jgi:hypothetical protein
MSIKFYFVNFLLIFVSYSSLLGINNNYTHKSIKELNVTNFGIKGDGITDNTLALDKLIKKAKVNKANLYFPNGTYIYNKDGMDASKIRFIGESKTGTIIKELALKRIHSLNGAENITFLNFDITDKNTSKNRIFKNCKFEINLPVKDDYVLIDNGKYTQNTKVHFLNCDFLYPRIWVALYIRKYNEVLIQNCTFNGDAWHNIRLDEPFLVEAKVNILDNTLTGGTTGIFIAPSRNISMKGGLIQGNKLYNQKEESIAMDGFGNDPNMIPVIANGPLSKVTNDKKGRLVISMDSLTYHNGAASPVSLRKNWSNFFFSFGEGSGLEGNVIRILSSNAKKNTLTLDTICSASNVKRGGDSGVQGGFFNWVVRNNFVTGNWGANKTYGTAISIYLNTFGILVENNTVTNCAHGISLAGGRMLDSYRSLSYNNIVRNNTFTDCDKYAVGEPNEDIGVIRFISYAYGGPGPLQYNNTFENNTVNGGRIFIQRQRNFKFDNNTISKDVIVKFLDNK